MAASSTPLTKPSLESLPYVGASAMVALTFKKRCVDYHWHFHPEFEFIYIKKGQGVCYIGASVRPYQAGDYFLIGANLPHSFGSYENQRCGAEWTVLHFLPELFGAPFWAMPQNRAVAIFLKDSARGVKFSSAKMAPCEDLLNRLEFPKKGEISMAIMIELLGRLAEIKDRAFINDRAFADPKTIHARLQKALAYIHENSSDVNLTQGAVAELIGLSPQAFCQLFKQGIGKSYTDYLHELRGAKACSEILHSNKSISAIAYDVGFNNLSNFYRRFSELTGLSPRKYRILKGGVSK